MHIAIAIFRGSIMISENNFLLVQQEKKIKQVLQNVNIYWIYVESDWVTFELLFQIFH